MKLYADRGQLLINGKQAMDLVSIDLNIDEAITVKETMTANKISLGYAKGNKKVSGSFGLAIPDDQAQLDLAFKYGSEISVVALFGANSERYNITGLVQNTQALKSGVGSADKTINYLALDAVNEGGPAVNSPVGL